MVAPERPIVPLSSSVNESPKPSVGSTSYEASSALANFITTPRISATTMPDKGLAASASLPSKTTPAPPSDALKVRPSDATFAEPLGVVPAQPTGASAATHVDKKLRKNKGKEAANKPEGSHGAMDLSV